MGITQIIDPFYTKLPEEECYKKPRVGQFCWLPVIHLDGIPRLLDVERAEPTEHYATKFSIRKMTANDFKKKARLPIKMLNLRETEEIIIHRAKKRPAVIIAIANTVFKDIENELRTIGRMHLQQANCFLVLPLYGIEKEDHGGGFPEVMAARIKALLYQQFFYFPKAKSPLIHDSIGRLDRIQPILYQNDVCDLEPCALSPEASSVLLGMIRYTFGSEKEPLLETVRELAFETLPDEARP